MRTSVPIIPSNGAANRRRRVSVRWSSTLVAALALGISGCGARSETPPPPAASPSPPPSSGSVAASTAAPGVVPTASPTATPAPGVGLDWQVLALPAAIPDGDLSAVAVDDHGWIAVGRRGAAGVLVLESADGRSWSEADQALFSIGDVTSVSVAGGPAGRVLLAAQPDGGTTAWQASPAGSWRKVRFPAASASYVSGVTWGAGRFLADGGVSVGTPNAHAGLWESSDGRTWHSITSGPRSDGGLTHVAAGFLLAGAVPDGGGSSYSSVWSSMDGTTWSKPKRLPGGDTAAAGGVAGGADGSVIWSDPPGSVIWTSPSGTTWSREVVTVADDAVFAVAPLGTGFGLSGRATTGDSDVLATRASLSAPWQVAPTPPDLRNSLVTALAGAPDGSEVVGVGNSGGGRPVIIVSPAR